MARFGEFPLDVIDGEITLAHGHGQFADAITRGCRLGTALGLAEKGGALVGVVAELMAKDTEGAWRIAGTAGGVGGELLVYEEGAEGLVLALEGELRGEKEVVVGWYCYLITSTDWHILIVLQKHSRINMVFWGETDHRGATAGWQQQLCNTFWLGAGTAWQADWIWYYTLKLYQDYIHLTYTDGIRPLWPLLGQPGNLKNKAWKSRLADPRVISSRVPPATNSTAK